jgi:hypothetical protein
MIWAALGDIAAQILAKLLPILLYVFAFTVLFLIVLNLVQVEVDDPITGVITTASVFSVIMNSLWDFIQAIFTSSQGL